MLLNNACDLPTYVYKKRDIYIYTHIYIKSHFVFLYLKYTRFLRAMCFGPVVNAVSVANIFELCTITKMKLNEYTSIQIARFV